MVSNREVARAFVAREKPCKNRNMTYSDGELYSYGMKIGWGVGGKFITPRVHMPSVTTANHFRIMCAALSRIYFFHLADGVCEWSRRSSSYETKIFKGFVATYRYSPRIDWDGIELRTIDGRPSGWSKSLVKYWNSDDFEKKALATVNRAQSYGDTEHRYNAIVQSRLWRLLQDIGEGCYGKLSIKRAATLSNRRLYEREGILVWSNWAEGMNKKTVRNAELLLESITDTEEVLLALAGTP